MVNNTKVLHTTDLGMFKKSPLNRNTDSPESQTRILNISKSMIEDGLLLSPIIVSSDFHVIDGSHRLEAAKLAGKGIYYIIDKSVGSSSQSVFEATKRLNVNSKEWTKNDYLMGYSSKGIKSYKVLNTFSKQYPMFTLTERLMLLNNSGTRHSNKRVFANGEYEIDDTQIEVGREWAEKLLKLKPYFPEHYTDSVFVRALLTIMEKSKYFSFEGFLRQVKKHPNLLKKQEDKKSYAKMIEHIYNFGRRVRLPIQLSAR